MNRTLVAILATLVFTLGLAACMVGPSYQRPELETPVQWRDEAAPDSTTLANLPWWELYADPVLQELITTALAENQDLKVAAERTVEAAARLGFTKADLWPQIDLSATGTRFQESRNGVPPIPDGTDNTGTVWDLSVPVSWELDLFGRIRSASASARAQLLASEAGQQAVTIALIAQVASSYASLPGGRRRRSSTASRASCRTSSACNVRSRTPSPCSSAATPARSSAAEPCPRSRS